ncbi:MAG: T9SS type A sorting domain-containing protein [Chitinophagaceae bacterium]|nr:T9SS type A sorting domain-containing protein [Chitinophagaceae bacterium]
MIIQYKYGGLDAQNNPIWDASNATTTAAPSEISDTRRIFYDSDADIMYIGGDVDNGNYGSFLKIRRYAHWSSGNRNADYTVPLPYNDPAYAGSSNYGGGQPVAFSVSGNYMFVLYGIGHVRIMDKSTGALVGTLQQNVNGWQGSDGQVDASYGMTVTKRSNGEYIIFFENAAWANIMMYRWQPPKEGDLFLTTPEDGKTYKVGPADSLSMAAFIGDSAHRVTKIAFFDGDRLIGSDTSAPYEFKWKASIGQHAVKAVAYERSGQIAAASPIAHIQVVALPDLQVTHISWLPADPKVGDQVTFSATVKNIGAGASPDSTLLGGLWSVNGQVVNYTDQYSRSLAPGDSVTLTANGGGTAPGTWVLPQVGSYTVNFLADDVNRIQEVSKSNNSLNTKLCIDTTNGRPSVKIDYPADGDSLTIGDDLEFHASYLDCGGTVVKVEFFSNKKKLGQSIDTSGTFTWKNLPQGTYHLRVKVTDNKGNSAYSHSVTVHITPVVVLPKPLVKLDFNENSGTTVLNKGTIGGSLTRTVPIPEWSKNAARARDSACVDFGIETGEYAVESPAVLPQLAGLANFTITGWVNNRDNTEGGGGNRMVTWLNDGRDGVELVYKADGSLLMGINQWSDAGGNPQSSPGKITTEAAAGKGNWRYFAATYASSTGLVQYYFGDTANAASLDVSATYNRGLIADNIAQLAIGHFNAATRSNATDRMFRGLMDNIHIYSSVLKPSQIVADQGLSKAAERITLTAACVQEGIMTRWTASADSNTKVFVLERSQNGWQFNTIARITPIEHAKDNQEYIFLDNHPYADTSFYRLTEKFRDGSSVASNVVAMKCSKPTISIYPNPVTTRLNIVIPRELLDAKLDYVLISVFTLDGRLVNVRITDAMSQPIILNTSSLRPGTYVLRILGKKINYTGKFIRQ